jgi:hypothetical protein
MVSILTHQLQLIRQSVCQEICSVDLLVNTFLINSTELTKIRRKKLTLSESYDKNDISNHDDEFHKCYLYIN